MTQTPQHRLGNLQLAIMQILWEQEEATVAEVHGTLLAERGLALTTIATMLRKLEDRKLVTHRTEGRQYVYRPLVTELEVRRSMVGDLMERLFEGDLSELVSHLLDHNEVDSQELKQLKKLIAARERGMEKKDDS